MSVVYIVGAPRSGTTWLQRMLGSHPAIASPQETDLISAYVAPLHAAWAQQLPRSAEDWNVRRHRGLPAVFTRDEFDASIRRFVESAYATVLACKPGARVLLEKNPIHSFHIETILGVARHARFVHLLRDGRDVVASLTRAAAGWGGSWAPSHVADATEVWLRHVQSARGALSAPGGYMEVRYEDLRSAAGPDHLRRVLAFCGVDATAELAGALFEQHLIGSAGEASGGIVWGGEVAARSSSEPREPDGFVGAGVVGGWRQSMSAHDRRVFNRVGGTLLIELGYASDGRWARPATWREFTAVGAHAIRLVPGRRRSMSRELLARAAPTVTGQR